ncbi:MAG: T9SS C-terminal target domain-containing protein [Chlorobi bacterium]|nr:T9SS C-terminal target domain-containing protein [Chlorobiota bacterium]
MKKISLITFVVLYAAAIFAQSDNPMQYQRWNRFDINKISTEFNNTGMLCNGNEQSTSLARQPSFEYPSGSGLSWGTCVGVAVGAPIDQDSGAVGGWPDPAGDYSAFCDATMDEGPAAYWDEEHFFPYPQFVNGNGALMSDDPETWPAQFPSAYPVLNDPILFDPETGWPGFGPNGEKLADQESFSVVQAWGGTDQLTATGRTYPNFLKTQMIIRGMAWRGTLYEDFIVWVYVIRNIGDAPIRDMRAAIHADFSFIPQFYPGIGYDDDRHYYDPDLQLAYGTDDDGYEESPLGGVLNPNQIPYAGVVALRMPGGDHKVHAYDAFHFWMAATTPAGNGARSDWYFEYNVENLNDPQDSDGDGIDDDFDENGVPDAIEGGQGYYLGLGADGLQTLGSAPFTLNPGEADTLIFATVFGSSEKKIRTTAKRAIVLYENNWEVIDAPPAPIVEAKPDDRKVKLIWGTESERDPEFEGYKIYRSSDGGVTWGEQTFKDFEGGVHYVPLDQFDLEDGIKGYYKTIPQYAWFYLGDDKWDQLRFTVEQDTFRYFDVGDTVNVFIDNDVVNGITYRYYIAAYDSGNGITGPLENGYSNNPEEMNNTVSVVARAPAADKNLDDVRVVPNPYIVAELWEQGLNDHEIQFVNMPAKATIRIFNSAGELIKTIYHEAANALAPSIAKWNLMNEYNQLVSPGVYFYYIDSDIGRKTGKIFIVL